MKTALFLFALLTASALERTLQAQDPTRFGGPGRITGVVVDGESPLQNVAITLRSAADSAVITGIMTDATGRFVLEALPLGEYRIRVSYIGYLPRESETIALTAAESAVDLGSIQ